MKTILALLLTVFAASAQTTYPMLSTTASRTVTGGATNLPHLTFTNNFTGPNTLTNSANVFAGNGAGLTGLVASAYLPLAGGTMAGMLNAANGFRYGDAQYTETSGNFGWRMWNAGAFGFSSGADASASAMDVLLRRDAAAVLAIRDSTTAQTVRIYGTFTDVTNYVRASLSATSTEVTLASETAGTGADNVPINLIPAGTSGVVIGSGGAGITKVLSATATLDFNLSAVIVEDLTITVTGAAVGDVVSLGVPNGSVTTTAQFTAWVSASDTVTVRCRTRNTEENPASGTFRATVIKH